MNRPAALHNRLGSIHEWGSFEILSGGLEARPESSDHKKLPSKQRTEVKRNAGKVL